MAFVREKTKSLFFVEFFCCFFLGLSASWLPRIGVIYFRGGRGAEGVRDGVTALPEMVTVAISYSSSVPTNRDGYL